MATIDVENINVFLRDIEEVPVARAWRSRRPESGACWLTVGPVTFFVKDEDHLRAFQAMISAAEVEPV